MISGASEIAQCVTQIEKENLIKGSPFFWPEVRRCQRPQTDILLDKSFETENSVRIELVSFEESEMKSIPHVSKYMTTQPYTIEKKDSLMSAINMMEEHRIRHLPVVDGGEIVGILSDRDITLVQTLREVDPETTTVEQAASFEPYITKPDALLNDVCDHMAAHRFGSAVVCDGKKLVGIFTWVDALQALSELLNSRLKS